MPGEGPPANPLRARTSHTLNPPSPPCISSPCNDTIIPIHQSLRLQNISEATDLAITFVDWAPAPHDANLGLWRDVKLQLMQPPPSQRGEHSGVSVRYPGVATKLLANNTQAQLEIVAEVQNWDDTHGVTGSFLARIDGLFSCSLKLTLGAAEIRRVVATAANCSSLYLHDVRNDMLWWPWQMGRPTEHTLEIGFAYGIPQMGADIADLFAHATSVSSTRVGLREATVTNDHNDNAVLRVNGDPST